MLLYDIVLLFDCIVLFDGITYRMDKRSSGVKDAAAGTNSAENYSHIACISRGIVME